MIEVLIPLLYINIQYLAETAWTTNIGFGKEDLLLGLKATCAHSHLL